jgi:glycosyltransferase involved in cell wall biosynthesis
MVENKKIIVVIPVYKVATYIENVVSGIPSFIDEIIVVDDKCPENSGAIIDKLDIYNVTVIYHETNQGVGGAVMSGFLMAFDKKGADIVVKIDGDGQMDCSYISKFIEPIIKGDANYTKGNRFMDFKLLKMMPKMRLLGNSALSFLIKMASGYWNMMDPTNGFIAISRDAFQNLNIEKIAKRYFFESDLLINLNIYNIVVRDISIPTKYGNEKSSLNILKTLFEFPPLIFKGLLKRIFFKYYIYDFNMASIYILLGMPMVLFGSIFGLIKWISGIIYDVNNSTGTIMLAVLPLILGTLFILQAIQIDINNVPKK